MRRIALGLTALVMVLAAAGLATSASGQDCDVRGVVETPPDGGTITQQNVIISGWAADLSATSGTGIQAVRISLDADPDQGGVPVPAQNGWERPDVAALLGSPRYSASGFALTWDTTGVPPGSHTLHIQVRTNCGWTANTRSVTVAARPGGATTSTSPAAPGASSSNTTPGGGTVTVPGGTVTVPGGTVTAPGVRPNTTGPATAPSTGGATTTSPGTGVTTSPGTGGVPGTNPAPGGVPATSPRPGGVPGGATAPGVAPTPYPPPSR